MDQIHHENYLIVIEVKNAEQLQDKVKTFLAHVSHRKILWIFQQNRWIRSMKMQQTPF